MWDNPKRIYHLSNMESLHNGIIFAPEVWRVSWYEDEIFKIFDHPNGAEGQKGVRVYLGSHLGVIVTKIFPLVVHQQHPFVLKGVAQTSLAK